MAIRTAVIQDLEGIKNLLDQLDYPGTEKFLAAKIRRLIDHPDEKLLVFEEDENEEFKEDKNKKFGEDENEKPDSLNGYKILAFISLHFIPQIALEGDFARISYFSVDQGARNKGIGRQLEEHCATLARERGCDRMEVHCHTRRMAAHHFYFRQGYRESPKYLIKELR